jgi:hypothetical protein
MKYIALCIMCKDDEAALIENIEYHTLIGVDHFIIYDNLSKRPLREALKGMSNVTVHTWADCEPYSQIRCYDTCLAGYRTSFRWIGFIDTDEFIVIKDGSKSIKDFLKGYERFGGLGINWKCFGSSGHLQRQQSIIESYRHAVDVGDNDHIKSIVNTQYVIGPHGPHSNPHTFRYAEGHYCVNEDGKQIKSPHNNALNSPATHRKAQINHYVTRSRQDFEAKQRRGGGNARHTRVLSEEFWSRFQDGQIDTSIHDFIKLIK